MVFAKARRDQLRRLALHLLPRPVELHAKHGQHGLLRFQFRAAFGERCRLRVEFALLAVEPGSS